MGPQILYKRVSTVFCFIIDQHFGIHTIRLLSLLLWGKYRQGSVGYIFCPTWGIDHIVTSSILFILIPAYVLIHKIGETTRYLIVIFLDFMRRCKGKLYNNTPLSTSLHHELVLNAFLHFQHNK